MALRVLAAVLLGAAAWQCAFVSSGAGPTRSPQVGAQAATGRSLSAVEEEVTSPMVSVGVGALVGLLVALAGASPAFAQRNQGYNGNVTDELVRYDKPAGTDNLLKELKSTDKKSFYEGKTDLDYRNKGFRMEESVSERALQKGSKM